MDPGRFFASSGVVIVAGKGGVGKTVAAATFATAAARSGRSVLLVEVGGRDAAAGVFGVPAIGYEPVEVGAPGPGRGRVEARSLTPDDALVEWLADHGFRRVARRMASTGLLEVVATATPGIKDLLVLGKIKQLEAAGVADLVVVDAPAAGHALAFLRSPAGVLETARSGAIHRNATEALELLTDRDRCRVVLVTIPEETPVNELVETAFALEDEIGVALGPVIVNQVLADLPGLDADPARDPAAADLSAAVVSDLRRSASLWRARRALQAEQLARMAGELPLPQLALPHLAGVSIGPQHLGVLADALVTEVLELEEAGR